MCAPPGPRAVAERTVIWKHALKNALLPVVTSIGMRFGCLLAGMVTTEQLFSHPGHWFSDR